MPIPDKIHVMHIDDWLFYNRRGGTQTKFSWLPRKCYLSGKPLFLKKSTVVTSMVTGPGATIFENFWCDQKEFFLNKFKK